MNFGELNRIMDAINAIYNEKKTYHFQERKVKVIENPHWAVQCDEEVPEIGSWCLLEVVTHCDGELDKTTFCATIWGNGWTDDGAGFEKIRKYCDDYQVIRWMQLTEGKRNNKKDNDTDNGRQRQ